ncbi:LytTR family DNA-binding domain-containing protein [Pontiellaceae bacterium B1224]|nr:LytTR family DNA-binding domain-containing protein [Pontiellaceae bacterium B1224]
MKCLLIEDEELFQIQLTGLLAEIGGIELVGVAADKNSGIELIRAHPDADLLILDVELPDGTCFDVISGFDKLPKLLFITSHENYALNAFELNALDYIQKPISLPRLQDAISRLDLPLAAEDNKLPVLAENDLVLLCCNKFRYFTEVRNIVAIHSDENYTHIIRHDGRRFIMKKTLAAWEKQLPEGLFRRIGRQLIVNVSALDRLEARERGGLLWFKSIQDPLKIKQSSFKNLQKITQSI